MIAYYSDERLKDRVRTLRENVLDDLLALDVFEYTPNALANELLHTDDKSLQVGFSAQQLQRLGSYWVHLAPFDIAPGRDGQITSKTGENYLTANYLRSGALGVALAQGVYDRLSRQIAEQQAQIDELKAAVKRGAQ